MKTKWIITIAVLFLIVVIPTVASPAQIYEAASVSRIVGNTPLDMQRQLIQDTSDQTYFLEKVGYAGGFTLDASLYSKQVLHSSFPGTYGEQYAEDVKQEWLAQDKKKLVIFDSRDDSDSYKMNNLVTANTLSQWEDYLRKKSLIVVNSQYAGLSLKGLDSFANKVSPFAPFIAPTFAESVPFLKTLACNLAKSERPLGEIFRESRNNYHWNIGDSSELIGIALLSYSLYGDPFLKIKVPSFQAGSWQTICPKLTNDFTVQSFDSTYQIAEANNEFTKTITLTIPDYALSENDNFSVINTQETELRAVPDELVLPVRVLANEFPLQTVITGAEIVGFSDPVDVTANIPTWNRQTYSERQCHEQTANAYIDFSHVLGDQNELVFARISPVEIIDCEKGQFKLYKKATYKITYHPFSPVFISGVIAPEDVLPGTLQSVTVSLENTQNSAVNGILAIKDDSGTVVSTKEVSTTQTTHSLEFPVPDTEGRYSYSVEFIQDNQSKTSYAFDINAKTLVARLTIPEFVSHSADADVHVQNNLPASIDAVITAELLHNGLLVDEQNKSVTLSSGSTDAVFTFSDLKKEDQAYDVLVTITYQGKTELLSNTLIVNHAPTILNSDLVLHEGDVLDVLPMAIDFDGDSLITNVLNTPFPIDDMYTLGYEDAGQYNIRVQSTDGIATVTRNISLVVKNTNQPPILIVPEVVEGKEGQQIVVNANAVDPDNQNSVLTDDNEIIITYDWPLSSNGTFDPSFEQAGDLVVYVTASDGELSDTIPVLVKIANSNRAPTLDEAGDITIKEGESVDLWKSSDPDNENEVTNDDNTLQMYFGGGPDGGPINHFGKWQTDYQDSGVYPITVQVEDGELKAGKLITLAVQNVNRPPVITAPDVVYASGSVDLSQYVTDPDNTNSVTTDDNTLTVTYTSPFDANGKWTPAQPDSAAQVTITASDGEFTVTKTIMVMVDVVGVQAVQSPPVQTTPEPQETPPLTQETTTPQQTTQQQTETIPTPQPTTVPQQTAQETQPMQQIAQQTQQTTQQEQKTTVTQAPQTSQTELVGDLEVKVIVDGKNMNDGDSVKVKPDKEFKVKIELKNNAVDEKEIDVNAELNDLDQDESDSLTLKPGESEQLKYTFDIPSLTDDDKYPLEITVNGKKFKITLKIDKPSHEITIESSVEPETVPCEGTSTKMKVRIENTGKNDEEGTITVESNTLKLLDEWPFDLPEGESHLFEKTINALVPGEHDISVKALYGKTAEANSKLTVESCKKEETQKTQLAPEERLAISLTDKKTAAPVISEELPAVDIITITFLVLTGIFAILILVFAIQRIR